MSSRFLSGGTIAGLDDGSAALDIYSATIQNLSSNLPVRTDNQKQLVATLLSQSDVAGLTTALAEKTTLAFNNTTAPTPTAGQVKIYSKGTKMYQLDENGVETELSSGASCCQLWQFSTLTSNPPAVGYLRLNNATPASASEVAINVTNGTGADARPILQTLSMGDQILLANGDSSNLKLYNINDSTDNTTWFSLLVSLESQNNVAAFANDGEIAVTFYVANNPFNQSLNTTDPATFASLSVTSFVASDFDMKDNYVKNANGLSVNKQASETAATAGELKIYASNVDNTLRVIDELGVEQYCSSDQRLFKTDTPTFSGLEMKEITTPSEVPPAGFNKLYTKADDNLYLLDSDGNETLVTQSTSTLQQVYEASTSPEITTNAINGALTIKNGTGDDENAILEVLDAFGSVEPVFSVNGFGIKRYDRYGDLVYNFTNGVALSNLTCPANSAPNVQATGVGNTTYGFFSAGALSTGDNNTCIGNKSGQNVNVGNRNTILGSEAGLSLSIGNDNIAVGYRALNGNGQLVSAIRNIAIGNQTMLNNRLGSDNVAIGDFAATTLENGIRNTIIGKSASTSTSDAQGRIAIGYEAESDTNYHCVIGSDFVGTDIRCIKAGTTDRCDLGSISRNFKDIHMSGNLYLSPGVILSGSGLTLILNAPGGTTVGDVSLTGNGGGNLFDSNGQQVDFVYTDVRADTPTECTFAGISAGNRGVQTGTHNTAFGDICMPNLSSGAFNTCIGPIAGTQISSGSYNTLFGYGNGANLATGSNNVLLGTQLSVDSGSAQGRISIGTNFSNNDDNHCVIESQCIRPVVDNVCDLGSNTVNYKDLYLTGDANVGTLKTNTITPGSGGGGGSVVQFDDNFTGATLVNSPTLTTEATFTPGSGFVRLTSNNTARFGALTYTQPAAPTLPTDYWEIETTFQIVDNDGDGNWIWIYVANAVLPAGTAGPGSNGYSFVLQTIANSGYIQIPSGVISPIGSVTGGLAPNTTHTMKVTCTNNTVFDIIVNGNSIFGTPYTDIDRGVIGPYYGMAARTGTSAGVAAEYRCESFKLTTGAPAATSVLIDADVNVSGGMTVPSINGITPVGGLFAQTADVVFTAATSPATQQMIGAGVGTLTVPANGFQVGDSFHLKCGGIKSNGNSNTIQIKLMSGAVVMVDTGVISLPGLSGAPWELEADFTVRTLGAAGVASLNSNGQLTFTDAGVYEGFGFNSLNNTTFDTTVSNTLTMDITQSNAGNLVSVTNLVLSKTF